MLKFCKNYLQMTHLLRLLDKMCKHEMDAKDTEQTQFYPQTEEWTDVMPVYTPFNFVEVGV